LIGEAAAIGMSHARSNASILFASFLLITSRNQPVTCLLDSKGRLWSLLAAEYLLPYYLLMSVIPPPFDWSTLQYNWYSIEGIDKLRRTVTPFLPYDPDPFQLKCTARMLNGQDVLCLCSTGGGKSALIYLASIARKGTITLVVCPTNFLESDLVRCSLLIAYG